MSYKLTSGEVSADTHSTPSKDGIHQHRGAEVCLPIDEVVKEEISIKKSPPRLVHLKIQGNGFGSKLIADRNGGPAGDVDVEETGIHETNRILAAPCSHVLWVNTRIGHRIRPVSFDGGLQPLVAS